MAEIGIPNLESYERGWMKAESYVGELRRILESLIADVKTVLQLAEYLEQADISEDKGHFEKEIERFIISVREKAGEFDDKVREASIEVVKPFLEEHDRIFEILRRIGFE